LHAPLRDIALSFRAPTPAVAQVGAGGVLPLRARGTGCSTVAVGVPPPTFGLRAGGAVRMAACIGAGGIHIGT